MSEFAEVAEAPAAASTPGTDTPTGQASGTPAASENQPTSSAAPSAQAPASTPKYRFKDQAEAEKAHSALQSRYSRLGDPDQAAQMLGLIQSLRQDPEFVEWAKARLTKHEAGSGDPETVKAVELVKNLARQEAASLVAPLVAPLQAQAAHAHLAAVFAGMTQKYGKEWEEHKPRMAELFREGIQAGIFNVTSNMKPSFAFVDQLYRLARTEDPEYGAKEYEKKLRQKQTASTQAAPGLPPGAVEPPPTKGLAGALRAAMKEHGAA